MAENKKNLQIAKITVFITSIFVIFMSVTYAFVAITLTGTRRQVITAGNLKVTLDEGNQMDIEGALPMYDEVGLLQEDAYTFQLQNQTNAEAKYTLSLEETSASKQNPADKKLATSIVKYGLTKNGVSEKGTLSSLEEAEYKIDEGTISGNQTNEYALRFWIDSNVTKNADIKGKSLSYKINIDVRQEN